MESFILEMLNRNYSVHLKKIVLRSVVGYSNVFIADCKQPLVIKIINSDYDRSIFLEQLYQALNQTNNSLLPIKSINNSYLSYFNGKVFSVFKKVELCESAPQTIWWAETLSEIHNLTLPYQPNAMIRYTITFAEQLLMKASHYFTTETYILLSDILNDAEEYKDNISTTDLVVCHGDTQLRNVMCIGQNNVLIDFDNCGFAIREYDIQRMVFDYLMETLDLAFCKQFLRRFLLQYERLQKKKISHESLLYAFEVDFVQTFSWLTAYVNSSDLPDIDRQKQEWNRYEHTISSGLIKEFITMLKTFI